MSISSRFFGIVDLVAALVKWNPSIWRCVLRRSDLSLSPLDNIFEGRRIGLGVYHSRNINWSSICSVRLPPLVLTVRDTLPCWMFSNTYFSGVRVYKLEHSFHSRSYSYIFVGSVISMISRASRLQFRWTIVFLSTDPAIAEISSVLSTRHYVSSSANFCRERQIN